MSGTLTTWRSAILTLLDDSPAARFTSAQIDAAIRQALQQYNATRPLVRTYSVDGQDAYQIVLPSDFAAEHITEVVLDNDSDPPTIITFYAFHKDEQWVIQTRNYLVSSSESILVTYTAPHTLDGLDGGAGTTIPLVDEYAVQIGAAGFALASRATSRTESINLQPEVAQQLLKLSEIYRDQFNKMTAPKPKPTFTNEPELRGDIF
jgi:hypothetical protein